MKKWNVWYTIYYPGGSDECVDEIVADTADEAQDIWFDRYVRETEPSTDYTELYGFDRVEEVA